MPKPSLQKNTSDIIWPIAGGGADKEVHAFPKGISQKVSVIAWLKFELAYFMAIVQHFSHHVMETPHLFFLYQVLSNFTCPHCISGNFHMLTVLFYFIHFPICLIYNWKVLFTQTLAGKQRRSDFHEEHPHTYTHSLSNNPACAIYDGYSFYACQHKNLFLVIQTNMQVYLLFKSIFKANIFNLPIILFHILFSRVII